ncbi:hypothetical protein HPB47_006058 [Ixodes persulcatus]|uniref:Uncharacterized protein n=1 Tax=Ixodes persulcatus TaxID=34615 RepID=A0AC60PB84_IXOPE|nr:hypothetical protein HPB47_006058 [Ixodes persulcatus]
MSLEPVCQLVEFQWNLTFKLAPKLRPELLDPNHFEKMKVIETFIVMSSNREQEDSSDEFRDSGSDMSVDTEEEPDVPSESQSDIDLEESDAPGMPDTSYALFVEESFLSDQQDPEKAPQYKSHKFIVLEGCLLERLRLYERRNTELLEGLRGKAIDLAGDGRCDSPRFSAKYCIYTFNEETTKNHPHGADELSSSNAMEKVAFVRGFNTLKDQGFTISSCMSNLHPGVQHHMRTLERSTTYYFDTWHLSNVVEQKLQAASRSGFCKELEVWIQPVTNHLYFCAMMGECNGPLLGDSPHGYNSTPTQTFKDFLFSTLKEVILRDDAADCIQSAVRGYRNLVFA